MGSMQLNKKKTRNIADETQASAAETNAAAEITPKPRTTRSSKTKKTETAETGSVKHHHKGASSVAVDAGTDNNELRTLAAAVGAAPVSATILDPVGLVAPAAAPEPAIASVTKAAAPHVTQEEIAKLAYTYWIARGYAEGGAEEDWVRAERELTAKR